MRRLVLKMQVTVDGFVGGTSGELDWIFGSLSDDATSWIVDTLWQAGVHVMGRTAYHDMAAHWPTSTEPFAAPMNEIPKVVFSKSLTEADWPETTIADGDLTEEITRLKQTPGKDIVAHGGARFVQSLAAHGLVDEYRLVVHPVTLGAGLPLFTTRQDLRLASATPFSGGAVALVYHPSRSPSPSPSPPSPSLR